MYTHIYICVMYYAHIYICIYIERERERYMSGKDKRGPRKGGFLKDISFSRIICYVYTDTIKFITRI